MAEYICREATLDAIREVSERYADENLAEFAYNIVINIPAADVQPVTHGRWLSSDSYITTAYGTIHCQICSECGADLMEDSDYDYDFCPVCGARMDE